MIRKHILDMIKILLYVVFCVIPALCLCLPFSAAFGILYLFSGIKLFKWILNGFLWILDETLSVQFN